jgi:hypothetical protein
MGFELKYFLIERSYWFLESSTGSIFGNLFQVVIRYPVDEVILWIDASLPRFFFRDKRIGVFLFTYPEPAQLDGFAVLLPFCTPFGYVFDRCWMWSSMFSVVCGKGEETIF